MASSLGASAVCYLRLRLTRAMLSRSLACIAGIAAGKYRATLYPQSDCGDNGGGFWSSFS